MQDKPDWMSDDYNPAPIYVSAEDFEKEQLRKQEQKELKQFQELKKLEAEIFAKGGSQRKMEREMSRKLKFPSFKDQLKEYYRTKNKQGGN